MKSFLSDEEWVSYLLMTDIFVHMQKSDAFSSTLAENLLLGHVVLNAEWLDYKDLEVNDVYYIKVSFEKLSSLIDNILKNMDKYKALAKENRNKIIRLKSLKYTISHCWIPYYKELAM